MKAIDSKGKLFGKISIIDILIVVIILGAAAGILFKFSKSGASGVLSKPDRLQITVFCPETPEYSVTEENIPKGSLLKDGVQGIVLGTVTGVRVEESIGYAESAQGEFKASSKEGYKSVYVTAETTGRYSENGAVINNSEFFVGQVIDKFRAGKSELRYNCRIYEIKKID